MQEFTKIPEVVWGFFALDKLEMCLRDKGNEKKGSQRNQLVEEKGSKE